MGNPAKNQRQSHPKFRQHRDRDLGGEEGPGRRRRRPNRDRASPPSCWAASDLEPVELYPLHIGSEYLAELSQIPLDPIPWSEQLNMWLVVASPEAVGPGGGRLALADHGGRLQPIDAGA